MFCITGKPRDTRIWTGDSERRYDSSRIYGVSMTSNLGRKLTWMGTGTRGSCSGKGLLSEQDILENRLTSN
jgi:hypothetical protein